MLRPLLAGAAVATLIATGALAQNTATEPAAPGAMAPAAGTMAPAAPTGNWIADEHFMPADVASLTAEEIIGADVRNADGEVVATVDDLVLGPDGKAQSIAAKFGGFLGFGSNTVLLSLDEVTFMKNDGGKVALETALTPDSLKDRPDYVKG